MIKHIVLFKFREDSDIDKIRAVFQHFTDLMKSVSYIQSYSFGPYNGCPAMPNRGFNYGFEMEFSSIHNRDQYMSDPNHLAVAPQVYELLKDGDNSMLAFGYDTDSPW